MSAIHTDEEGGRAVPRINVWIPEDLHRSVKERLPGINVSAIVQGALAAQLECRHPRLVCSSCATPVDHRALIDDAMSACYRDMVIALDRLMREGGTVEGSIRVVRDACQRHQVTAASQIPLPRPSRANRAALEGRKVSPLPKESESRQRHPTARRRATA